MKFHPWRIKTYYSSKAIISDAFSLLIAHQRVISQFSVSCLLFRLSNHKLGAHRIDYLSNPRNHRILLRFPQNQTRFTRYNPRTASEQQEIYGASLSPIIRLISSALCGRLPHHRFSSETEQSTNEKLH